MKLPLVLATLLLAQLPPVAPEDAPTRRTVPLGFAAECTLTPEILDQALIDLQSFDTDDAAEAILEEHEVEHGWSFWLDGLDYIDAAHAVPCPAAVLDRMAAFRTQGEQIWIGAPFPEFAKALERSGRLEQALALLDAELVKRVASWKASDEQHAAWTFGVLPETAAKLCARHGLFERALEYAEHWEPDSDCGNCSAHEQYRIDFFRQRMLAGLGRCDEAIRGLVKEPFDAWHRPAPPTIALWIDCLLE